MAPALPRHAPTPSGYMNDPGPPSLFSLLQMVPPCVPSFSLRPFFQPALSSFDDVLIDMIRSSIGKVREEKGRERKTGGKMGR